MYKKLQAVVLDCAGTVLDFGSFAPTSVFVESFKQGFDFDITMSECRQPMGLGKLDHIRALGKIASVNSRWQEKFGRSMNEQDAQYIYKKFIPLQQQKVTDYADLIPGAKQVLDDLRRQNIKIGACTGYPREVLDCLIPLAKQKGFDPDSIIATDDLPAGGRPGPWMALQNVINMRVTDVAHCVKVDDSAVGITEGKTAGMWTVAIVLSGNASGLTLDEFTTASSEQIATARTHAHQEFSDVQPDYSIDTIADLPNILQHIDSRLQNGERP